MLYWKMKLKNIMVKLIENVNLICFIKFTTPIFLPALIIAH